MEEELHLADSTSATTPGQITLPIRAHGRRIRYAFRILPTLESAMLIGTDLWTRLRLTLPLFANSCKNGRTWSVTIGFVPRTAAEEQELQTFLTSELAKFKDVHGPTTRITHIIRTKTPSALPTAKSRNATHHRRRSSLYGSRRNH